MATTANCAGAPTPPPRDSYLDLFTKDVVGGLSPLLSADPEMRIYETV